MSKDPRPWPQGEPWFTDPPLPERETASWLEFWRLCEDLTVSQAALLIVGREPTSDNQYDAEQGSQPPVGYEATREAIKSGLLRGALAGEIIPRRGSGLDGSPGSGDWLQGTVDIFKSKVEVASLKNWLSARGVETGFFFSPKPSGKAEYLDPHHPRYAPKLAAAVRAWLATEGKFATKGKPPKTLLEEWLLNMRTSSIFAIANVD